MVGRFHVFHTGKRMAVIAAFFIGRYTAQLPAASTPPVDPCAEVHKAYQDLKTTAGWEVRDIGIAQMHLVVDHPECYSPQFVAQAKALLDMAARQGG